MPRAETKVKGQKAKGKGEVLGLSLAFQFRGSLAASQADATHVFLFDELGAWPSHL